MPFQKTVNTDNPLAIAGDFASTNPRSTVVSPEGGFVAGSSGVNVGLFAWVAADGKTVNNTAASGVPDGFVHREQQALITTYLAEAGVNIPVGFGVTLHNKGDFWAKVTVAGATKGQKVFAKLADGTIQAANAGATVSGFVETPWVIGRTCLVNELTTISL